MVSAKDLRDLFEDVRGDAGKRASDAIRDAMRDTRMPKVSLQRNEPPVMLWFGIGMVLGAAIGVVLGAVMTPYRGAETRRIIGQQVQEQVKKARRAEETNGAQRYEPATPTEAQP